MARDRLAAIRERRAQGLTDPPSPPRCPPSPVYQLEYDFAVARDSPVSAPPDSPRDFNPFARFEAPPAPATPSPRSSRHFPAPKAPTGWFSGFGWGWNAAPSATDSSPRQPSLDYGQRNLPPIPAESTDSPVLEYGAPPVATEAIAPAAIPEAPIPLDFDPNQIARPARLTPRISEPDRLESPRSSVVLSPAYQVEPNLPPPVPSSGSPQSPKKTRRRRVSIVPISPKRASAATIIEEDFVGEEKDADRDEPGPDVSDRPRISKGDVPYEDMPAFFEQITDLQQEVRRAHSLIQIIGSLRDRLLAIPSADSPVAIEVREDLDSQTTAARSLFTSIQTRLRELEQGNANLRVLIPAGQSSYDLSLHDVDIRQQQVGLLKERFKEVIQRYAAAEQEHRAKQRVRLERQIRVVNPSLPPDEMKEVIDRAEAGVKPAIFAQATTGLRSQAARGALREVQNRAAELARIEQTLIELAQLFQDMAIMVEAQDVLIAEIEQTAATVNHDMEKGVEQVQVAVKHARNARKWRWVCCAITTIILVIVAVVLCAVLIPPALRARRNTAPAA